MGGYGAAVMAFAVAATALVVLVLGLATVIATARGRFVETLEASGPAVKRWGGRVLIVVGAWFVALAIFAGFFAGVFPV